MAIETFRSLDDMRLEARNGSYPNTATEIEAVTNVEHEVRKMVEVHEDHLVNVAHAVLGSGERVMDESDALLREMWDLNTDIERAGPRPGTDLATRYERIRKRMELLLGDLAKIERDASFQAAKVADPYGSLQDLRRRYPQIVAGRRLQ